MACSIKKTSLTLVAAAAAIILLSGIDHRAAAQSTIIESRVASGNDDGEENQSGGAKLSSGDLEMADEKTANPGQTIGMRFADLGIPPGARIISAHVQFQADETGSDTVALEFRGEAIGNAATFSDINGNITSRSTTTAFVDWAPPPWSEVGAAGADQRSPDLTAIIQEIIDLPGWVQGNALAIIVTGSGKRTAESYDGRPSGAPLLHVEYDATAVDQQPVAQFSADPVSGDAPLTVSFDATNSHDPDGAIATHAWDFGDGATGSGATASHVYSSPGTYTVTLIVADDGGRTTTATQAVTATARETASVARSIEVRVATGDDDAEENQSGGVKLSSGDLEMADEKTANPGQTIGVRFAGLGIPPGARIISAHVQFQADETGSGPVALRIRGEAIGNAATFLDTKGNISSRPTTTAFVDWAPPAWSKAGAAGADQRTLDLSAIIQEIIDLPSWAQGNALAIIVTGSGKRTAESYDGRPSGAPLLQIEFEATGSPPPDSPPQPSSVDPLKVAFISDQDISPGARGAQSDQGRGRPYGAAPG